MLRPYRIRLGPGGNEVDAILHRAVFAGDTMEFHLDAAGIALVIEAPTRGPGTPRLQPGDAVAAAWDVADTLLFPA